MPGERGWTMREELLLKCGGPVMPITTHIEEVSAGKQRCHGLAGMTMLEHVAIQIFRLYVEKGLDYETAADCAFDAAQTFLKVRDRFIEG